MKRSKLYLTVTTCCLAIAGIAFAKSHRSPTQTGYFKNSAAGCILTSSAVGVTALVSHGVTLKTVSGTKTVQTAPSAACSHAKLYIGNE